MSLSSMFKWRKQGNRPSSRAESPAAVSAVAAPSAPAPKAAVVPRTTPLPASFGGRGNYALVLQQGGSGSADEVAEAWEALEDEMGLVPAGEVARRPEHRPDDPAPFVASSYIDRYAVTNKQFAQFLSAGGYDEMDLWPEEAWPNIAQFVDQMGHPGPRYWRNGQPPKKQDNYPVTGVCWYEANAYAMWAGKRLPSSFEWERAATWPTNLDDHAGAVRYPWGNAFDPKRANTASADIGGTVDVNAFSEGCTPNGVYQLVGNVWEWIADEYTGPPVRQGLRVFLDHLMAEIRGGAYNTYFDTQCTGRFRTGQSLLCRSTSVGFRCVVSPDDLRRPADASEL